MKWEIEGRDVICWAIALISGLVVPILVFLWGKKTTEDLKKQISDEVEERKKLAKEVEERSMKSRVLKAIELLLEDTEKNLQSYFESDEKGKEKNTFCFIWLLVVRKKRQKGIAMNIRSQKR